MRPETSTVATIAELFQKAHEQTGLDPIKYLAEHNKPKSTSLPPDEAAVISNVLMQHQ